MIFIYSSNFGILHINHYQLLYELCFYYCYIQFNGIEQFLNYLIFLFIIFKIRSQNCIYIVIENNKLSRLKLYLLLFCIS